MGSTSTSSSVDEMEKANAGASGSHPDSVELRRGSSDGPRLQQRSSGLRPLSMAVTHPVPAPGAPPPEPSRISGWVGSFFAQRASRVSVASSRRESNSAASVRSRGSSPMPSSPMPENASQAGSTHGVHIEEELPPGLQVKNLDEVYATSTIAASSVEEEELHESESEPAGTGFAI